MSRFLILLVVVLIFCRVNAQEPNDCVNAVVVCGNGNFTSNATGFGNEFEVDACGGFENNSLWLEVNIVQSGTLGFDLIPNDPDIMVDYDFWVYGPNRLCSNLGNPIRCATTNPNEAGLTSNLTGINGSTTLTQTGPGANGNGYVFWLNVIAGESYFIVIDRPEGEGGFEIQWTGTANEGTGAFPEPPNANEIDDVKQCSGNPDISIFDLNGLRSSINSDPLNTIEFYESLADATDDINELPGIYANTSNPQTIYAKVKSSGTDCYTLVDFDLIVTPIPDASVSTSSTAICEGEEVTFNILGTPGATIFYSITGGGTQQVLLDDTGSASIAESPTTDITFDLEDAQILSSSGAVVCSQVLSESVTVTVSTNTAPTIVNNSPICEGDDAELQFTGDANASITYTINGGVEQSLNLDVTGVFTLTIPALTSSVDVEIISVTSAVIPNCVLNLNNIETIVVNPLPTVIDPDPLLICNDGVDPNSAAFDLDAQSALISNNEANVTVTYYETQVLAETGNPADSLASPYASTSANQTIYVRVETDLGCVDFTTLNLQVIGAPIANTIVPLQSCDANNLGLSIFDLTQAYAQIIAGNTQDVQVSYYVSQTEAEAGSPEIVDVTAFQNTTAYNQTIFARVDSDATECFTITTLDLEVFDTPVLNTLQTVEVCDDAINDGIAQFDLDAQTPLLLGGATDVTVSYHASQSDAEDDIGFLTSPYTNISSPQTIFIRAENNFNPDCFEITTFNLEVNPLPQPITPTPLEVCDDGTPDGITEMDLSLKNPEITGSNPNYAVSYYLTLTDAETETSPLPTLYTNTSNGQIISVRVEDINTGCYDTTTLELIVQQAPVAFTPQPLRYCDPDNDGFGVFTLTDADNEITGAAAGLTVSYHETLTNAQNNVDAIDTSVSYNNIVVNTQTLYVRVESATITTDCATLVELQLIVEPTPQLIDPSPLEACDDISADGFASFDLTSKAGEILNGQDPAQYTLSYYETQANAEAANNPIASPIAYTNTNPLTQIIWIRVEDNTTVEGCYKITSLELIVNPLPVLITPAPLTLCDANNPGDEQEAFTLEEADDEILNGQTGISLSYYETQLDADNGTSPIVSPYVNTISNPQTIFVRAENDVTGCSNTVTLTLRVNPIPSPEPNPEAIEVCDDDNDGFAEFDLEQRTVAITNGELDVNITYHETQDEAEQGDNPITGLYTNIVANNQMIYVRSENTLTGCYSLTLNTLELIVQPAPEVPTALTDYVLCDTDANGITQFDLTTKDDEILNGQNPTEVTLSYHVSAADAASGNNPIINTGNYTNTTNPQVIYVRLFNPTTGCQDTGTFELQVELPPVAVQPTQLSVCDDLGEVPGDEVTVFDLTVKDTEITAGNASWSVAYYETNADAQAQTNNIPDPTQYTNTSVNGLQANPQTLYVVVTDTDTGCTDQTTLTIRVLPNPTPTPSDQLPDLELCDDINTGDGQEVFDLTENELLLLNGETGVTVSYHETAEDADSNTNAIVDPTQYTNSEAGGQEIYVRVTNDVTGCYALVNFTVIVYPLPEVVAVTDFIQCELNTDGIDNFNLTTKDEEVLNGQDPTQFIVSYHASLTDAEAGINGLVSPYTNQSNPQQIFVTITNNQTGCSISTQSFNIEVQEAAQANPDLNPIVYEECDDNMETDADPSNDSVQFDLTTQDADVLDGQDPTNYIVRYFATEADANLNVNPLPTLYENITNPQVIYARVDNDTPDAATGADTSICYAVAPLTLQVNPLPEFDLEDTYTLCINTNGTETLDPLVIDTGLSTVNYSFEWSYNGDILPTELGSSITPTQGGTYSVIVTDTSTSIQTSCLNADSTEVIESEPPVLEVTLVTQAFADNNVIEAIATAAGGSDSEYEYSLDGGPWQDSGVFSNVSAGEHEITARDKFGCGLTTQTIFVIDYPLYFTPNGDGNNDTWAIEGIGSTAKIYIFDRYGKLLKQLSPTGSGWDGTYNGNRMPSNDYWFTVEYTEPSTNELKEFRAHFTLKR